MASQREYAYQSSSSSANNESGIEMHALAIGDPDPATVK
jgi:hypothetical protein